MTFRRRLSARAREELWKAQAAKARENERGEYPICVHCDEMILPGRLWDACHDPHKPRWMGGEIVGCGHMRCNRMHGSTHDTPKFAKNERIRKRHLDFTRSDNPLPGGRDDRLKKKLNGQVVQR